jgi:uncharacterized membrane protein (UPF0127 family)
MVKMKAIGLVARLSVFLCLLIFIPNVGKAQSQLQTFEKDLIRLALEDGGEHEFQVELAVTWEQQAQGLMFRQSMPEDHGMLFLYESEGPRSMWMKNTYIPLDILFIGGDGRILSIAERTVPLSLSTISSGRPAKAVLELNGGTADRLGIRPGDLVLYSAFGTAP